jgi:hypothetical protein
MGLSLLLVGQVCADMPGGHHYRPPLIFDPPPAPPQIKYSDALVRIAGIEKYPDQVFCVSYATSATSPSGQAEIRREIVEVKTSDTITFKNTDGKLQLLAMKRDEFNRRAKADPTLHWLDAGTKGVMVAHTLMADEPPMVTTCKVTVSKGFLWLKSKFTVETLPDRRRGQLLLPPTWVLGMVGSLLAAGLGLWFTRRPVWRSQRSD